MGTSTEDIMFEVSTPASAPHRTPTRELHATYTTFEILVALVAIVGNAMVIYVFRCERRLRRRTNYYIVSLAVADLLVGLLGIPFAILASVGLPKNLYACLFTCSLLVMLCTISIFCLVAVSVDRYWAILHPMCYSRNVRTKTAIGAAGGDNLAPPSLYWRQAPSCSRFRQLRVESRRLRCTMGLIHAIFIYANIINVCVIARGGGHGGHGGGHGGHGGGHGGYGSHGGGHHGGHSSRGYGSYGYHYVTASHTHYTYHPPRSISCHSCSSSTTYPVYRQQPPTYVYVYKDSNSRYNQLLTGLALYNLGRSSGGSHHSDLHYTVYPQEKCSMQIIKGLHFEETEIPCFMISSFTQPRRVNNTLSVDITSSQIDVKSYINSGEPIEVTEGQECILWRNSSLGKEIINDVPCTLLKEYANTVRPSGVPVYIWLPTLLASILTIYLCCWCFYKKKKESVKETAPLNEAPVAGYCANY